MSEGERTQEGQAPEDKTRTRNLEEAVSADAWDEKKGPPP